MHKTLFFIVLILFRTNFSLALVQSPAEGKGFFIKLKNFQVELYGVPSNDILEEFSKCSSYLEKDDTFYQMASLRFPETNRGTMKEFSSSIRQSIVNYRKKLHDWMFSKLKDSLFGSSIEDEIDSFEIFWISPVAYSRRVVNYEILYHSKYVEKIMKNDKVAEIVEPVEVSFGSFSEYNWHLNKIGAPSAWNKSTGAGITVGILDTGVRWTHEILISKYAGLINKGESVEHDYSWYDPKEFRDDEWWCYPGICSPKECCMDEPFDVISHGSHVTGILLGSLQNGTILGVAPDAKWIAAKGCRDGGCYRYGLLKSAEFLSCPTDRNGSNPDCSKTPDIINNSWGAKDSTEDFFKEIISIWRTLGIIPVFANGNYGPSCGTVNSPGDFANVIGVGATNMDDALTDFSSRGPGPVENEQDRKIVFQGSSLDPTFGKQKPDFSAPGFKIMSAVGHADDKYVLMSGTSMAAPVVSGVIALILSNKASQENYDNVYEILKKSSETKLPEPKGMGGPIMWPFPWKRKVCGKTNLTDVPNMFYGYGRVDARVALNL